MEVGSVLKNPFAGIAAVLIMSLLVVGVLPNSSAQAFSGSGTGENQGEEYIITTCSQLQEMSDDLDAWYKLGNDIDCSATASWNGNAGFMPVGDPDTSFHGILEGAGHTISNLTINRPDTDYVGLFGYIGGAGSAQRFRFKNISISGQNYVGGVAGQTLNGDVYNIGITGEVNGATMVGGAVGDNGGGVMNVYSHAAIGGVPGSGVGGGLVGENHGFTIRSYSTGIVPSGPGKGGIIGHDAGSGGVSGAFWNTQTSGHLTSSDGTGKTTAELKNIATFTSTATVGLGSPWDFVGNPNDDTADDDTWNINTLINQGYPYLTAQTPGLPNTTITASPASPTNNGELSFEFNSSVGSSTFECKIEPDVTSFEPCSEPYVHTASDDGTYTFTVRAINSDGVADPTPESISILVDTQAPDTFLMNATPSPITTSTTSINFSANEMPATYECNYDNGGYGVCTSPFTTPTLTEGEHTLLVRAIDGAGNADASPATHTWSVTLDSDGDGILDAEENDGPIEGDANNDNVLDSSQPNVASLRNPLTDQYMVVETDCESLEAVQVGGETDDPADPNYDYPMGLTSFQATCQNPGDTAQIRQYYYGVESSDSFSVRKWMNDGSYAEIPGYNLLEMPLDADASVFYVQYNITDGSTYDDDGEENGLIFDPSGVAILAASNGGSASNSDNDRLADTGISTTQTALVAASLIGAGLVTLYSSRLNRRTEK